jgi:hypothetical protein
METAALVEKAATAVASPEDPPEFGRWLEALRKPALTSNEQEEIYWAIHELFCRRGIASALGRQSTGRSRPIKIELLRWTETNDRSNREMGRSTLTETNLLLRAQPIMCRSSAALRRPYCVLYLRRENGPVATQI